MEKILTDKVGQICSLIQGQKVVIRNPYIRGPEFHRLCLVEDNLRLISVRFYPVETAAIYRHKGGQTLYLYGTFEEFKVFPKLFKELAERKAKEEAKRKPREKAERMAQVGERLYLLCKEVIRNYNLSKFNPPAKNPALPYYRRHTQGQFVFAQEIVNYVELGTIYPDPTKKFKQILKRRSCKGG